jgi:hypothetical protein
VPWIIELSGGFGQVADSEGVDAFARAIEAVLEGRLPVDATVARSRLIEAIGERAVGRQAREVYEGAVGEGVRGLAGVAPEPSATGLDRDTGGGHSATEPPAGMPRLLAATGRDQALRLVAELPIGLQQRIALIVPARAANPDENAPPVELSGVQVVDAEPVPPPTPRPSGRSPVTRVRRALWRPAPTGPELLESAVLGAAKRSRSGGLPVVFVALDAPAAALIGRLDSRRVRLAPGGLRWLADRWDAERPTDN